MGENKKKGDWSLLANYRQIGIGAIDPNLNDSDWRQSELNTRGVKLSVAYNFTDVFVGAVTYQHAWNLRNHLVGGEATGGNAIADANAVQTVQVDSALSSEGAPLPGRRKFFAKRDCQNSRDPETLRIE